ncbi:MAG: DUF192 domain-containing protein [Planctomycetota bacterium]
MNCLRDANDDEILFRHVQVAESFWQRAVGLMGRTSLSVDEAFLIRPCRSIHTCFMRMAITAAFCDKDGNVLKVASVVRPWRMRFGPKGTHFVIESATNSNRLEVGQRIQVCETDLSVRPNGEKSNPSPSDG